jgi:hypothetical protein
MSFKKFVYVFALVLFVTPSVLFAQETRKPSPSKPPVAEVDEKVYSVQEVDIEAELKNMDEVMQAFLSKISCDFPDTEVTLSIVLNKSGKVSDVKVDISSECPVPEKAVEELMKLKFTPASKANVPVSELFQIQMPLAGDPEQ